jgi:competence ComEA-like helix-hairpin-helix protein
MTDNQSNFRASSRISLRMRDSDRRCLMYLMLGVVAVSLARVATHKTSSPALTAPPRFRVDLNAATSKELVLLPGIGEVRANAIVESREEFGPFESVEDVQRVKGIGPKTLAGLEEWVYIVDQSPAGLVSMRTDAGTNAQPAPRLAERGESPD